MKVIIDENITIPATKRKSFYPWDEMEKGDSFATKKLISTTNANKKYAPKKYKCKPFEGAFRVWRVE